MEFELQRSNYQVILEDTFSERRSRNPSYSLRAFARDLGLSPAALSELFANKRRLSKKNIQKVGERLGLSPLQIKELHQKGQVYDEREILEDDVFRLMSDWFYFAILSLSRLKTCPADPQWIAERLNISEVEATSAVRRLLRLGLIEKRGRSLKRTSRPLTTTEDVPSSAARKLNAQLLERARLSQEKVPVDLREVGSITFAIDPSLIPKAKEMIRRFRDRLDKHFQKGKKKRGLLLPLSALSPISVEGERMKHWLGVFVVFCGVAFSEGDVGGNGGDVVVCKKKGASASYEMLDYFEGRSFEPRLVFDLGKDNLRPEEKVHLVLDRLESFDPDRVTAYRKLVDGFLSSKNVTWIEKGDPLKDIPDSGKVTLPEHCKIHQLAIRRPVFHPSIPPFIIDKRLWVKMDNNHKAGLILHEIVYGETLSLGQKNSIRARRYNALVSSTRMKDMTDSEYKTLSQETFVLESPIEFDHKSMVLFVKKNKVFAVDLKRYLKYKVPRPIEWGVVDVPEPHDIEVLEGTSTLFGRIGNTEETVQVTLSAKSGNQGAIGRLTIIARE